MRHKWIAGLLAIAVLGAMGGCSGTEDSSSKKEKTSSATESSIVEESSETEALTEEQTEAETSVEETQAENSVEESGSQNTAEDEIRPDIKEAIDKYESFMNQYCDFMKSYDATDMSLLSEYSELMTEYAEMSASFDAIENEDLTTAELAYYMEVQSRVSQALLEVSNQ